MPLRGWVMSISFNMRIHNFFFCLEADTPLIIAQRVLESRSTLPIFLVGRSALVEASQDFEADVLWHGVCPCFGADPVPHLHVGTVVPSLPAGAVPHLPMYHGRWRGCCVAVQDRLPATPNTSHAGWGRCHTHKRESVVKGVSWHTSGSRDSTAIACLCAWKTRSGCRRYL